MKLALLLSFIIHVTILQHKIPKPIPQPKPKQAKIKIKIKQEKKIVKPKGNDKADELYMLNKVMTELVQGLEKEKRDRNFVEELFKKKCTKSYRGIGITYDTFLYQHITKIGKNTPAAKAGLRVGDKMIDRQPIRNIYPIGTTITLPILRNGIILYINVTIGKICTN